MAVDLHKLSISELEKLKKRYTKLYKTKLIDEIKKLRKETKQVKPKPKMKKPKTFEEYFQECIKNRRIPPDSPPYLRKALERAMREYDLGMVRKKSALEELLINI